MAFINKIILLSYNTVVEQCDKLQSSDQSFTTNKKHPNSLLKSHFEKSHFEKSQAI